MALDFDAIKRKLAKLSGNNRNQSVMWKPIEGEEHTVRLISFSNNDGQPFKELWFYYNIPGQRGLLAPYQFKKSDPIQDLITKLRDEGTKESYELAKKLYPKMRVYAAVVVRGQEDKGVQIWAFGKTVYQSLLNYMLDEDYGDITDPVSGRDIVVDFKTSEETGRAFPSTTIRVKPNQTPVTENTDTMRAVKDSQKEITDIYNELPYDELKTALESWLDQDNEVDKDDLNLDSVKNDSTPKEKKEDVSAAFDELFNN